MKINRCSGHQPQVFKCGEDPTDIQTGERRGNRITHTWWVLASFKETETKSKCRTWLLGGYNILVLNVNAVLNWDGLCDISRVHSTCRVLWGSVSPEPRVLLCFLPSFFWWYWCTCHTLLMVRITKPQMSTQKTGTQIWQTCFCVKAGLAEDYAAKYPATPCNGTQWQQLDDERCMKIISEPLTHEEAQAT